MLANWLYAKENTSFSCLFDKKSFCSLGQVTPGSSGPPSHRRLGTRRCLCRFKDRVPGVFRKTVPQPATHKRPIKFSKALYAPQREEKRRYLHVSQSECSEEKREESLQGQNRASCFHLFSSHLLEGKENAFLKGWSAEEESYPLASGSQKSLRTLVKM